MTDNEEPAEGYDINDPYMRAFIDKARMSSPRRRQQRSVDRTSGSPQRTHRSETPTPKPKQDPRPSKRREETKKRTLYANGSHHPVESKRRLDVDMSSWDRRAKGPDRCAICGERGMLYARGLCTRCYRREYWRFRYGSGSEYFQGPSESDE